jgi:hypothetical protein
MATIHRLDAIDLTGAKQFEITDFRYLTYNRRVNAPGVVQFGLRGAHPLLAVVQDKWEIEVWRKMDGYDWTQEIVGMVRRPDWSFDKQPVMDLYCQGIVGKLSWRYVLYVPETASRSLFTSAKAETIMKTLVNYNAGSSATTGNGRHRNGAITGLSVQADGANGNTKDWACAYDNLLETLQKLALVAGGDFDLIKTGANAWEFRWYTGQRGTDRTTTVKFSMALGNMANVKYSDDRMDEKTVGVVLGQGEGSDRDLVIRTGTNYSASNDIELYINASDIPKGQTTALQDRGDQKLTDAEAVKEFSFDVLQTPASRYGVHYFLGDLVTAINPVDGSSITEKIQAVTVSVTNDQYEKVQTEMSTRL